MSLAQGVPAIRAEGVGVEDDETVVDGLMLLDASEARDLTDRIKHSMEGVWTLLLQAHERQAWRALGYLSWRAYAVAEFDLSQSRAYQLLDKAKVVAALDDAGAQLIALSARDVKAIKPVLDDAVNEIRERIADGEHPVEATRAVVAGAKQRAAARFDGQLAGRDTRGAHGGAPESDVAYSGEIAGNTTASRRPPVAKPDLGGVSHPARFHSRLIETFADLLATGGPATGLTVLDPFAGTGRIHELRDYGYETTGVELEPEWANLSPHTIVGDALALPFADESFDAVVTSPTYGNRLADHHHAVDPDSRRSYTHDLGRQLHDHNSGRLQWGDAYRDFHLAAWAEAYRVLRDGGAFILNIKDHIRNDRWQDVAGWHVGALCELGLDVEAIRPIVTPDLRQGANATKRVAAELVICFGKGSWSWSKIGGAMCSSRKAARRASGSAADASHSPHPQ